MFVARHQQQEQTNPGEAELYVELSSLTHRASRVGRGAWQLEQLKQPLGGDRALRPTGDALDGSRSSPCLPVVYEGPVTAARLLPTCATILKSISPVT